MYIYIQNLHFILPEYLSSEPVLGFTVGLTQDTLDVMPVNQFRVGNSVTYSEESREPGRSPHRHKENMLSSTETETRAQA